MSKDNIEILPNPSNGIFEVKGLNELVNLVIYDILGRNIFEACAEKSNMQDRGLKVDLHHIEKGIYFLRCNSDNYSKAIKIVIQ